MKQFARLFPVVLTILVGIMFLLNSTGCANIIPPGGGPRDSLPPVLIAVTPPDSATNVRISRINFTFNEYVELQNVQENVLVSPTPLNAPFFDNKLRNVSVRLRDTLEPNTTYSINFGDAIRDINEGNILKNFTYVFSTGSRVDFNTFSGRVIVAETGQVDTTLIVVLHRNLDDSAVAKDRPRYITRLDSKGNFTFRNLPEGTFAVYALPNEYSKRYDDPTKLFAFADSPIVVNENTRNVSLFAYIDSIKAPGIPGANAPSGSRTGRAAKGDTVLKFTNNLAAGRQDLLGNIVLEFNRKIVTFDSSKVILTNKAFQPFRDVTITRDTNLTRFVIAHPWPPATDFRLLIGRDAFADSTGLQLPENDTLVFTTSKADEYGSVRIRFANLDFTKNPVLQITQNNEVVESSPLVQRDFSRKLFKPGEYGVRILYDANKNGKWDKGSFFGDHRQPETVRFLDTKLTIRANWDNEKEIRL